MTSEPRIFLPCRDPQDARLWIEWCTTMKGKVDLYWSKGLRGRLLGDAAREDAGVACDPGDEGADPYLCSLEPRLVERLLMGLWSLDGLMREVRGACERWGVSALGQILQAFLKPGEGEVRFDPEDRVYWWDPTDRRPGVQLVDLCESLCGSLEQGVAGHRLDVLGPPPQGRRREHRSRCR